MGGVCKEGVYGGGGFVMWFCFFQAEDGIRDLVRSRGLGDVYKRQLEQQLAFLEPAYDQLVCNGNERQSCDRLVQVLVLSLIHI